MSIFTPTYAGLTVSGFCSLASFGCGSEQSPKNPVGKLDTDEAKLTIPGVSDQWRAWHNRDRHCFGDVAAAPVKDATFIKKEASADEQQP